MDAKQLFDEALPEFFEKYAERARDIEATFFFNIIGEGKWLVDMKSDKPVCEKMSVDYEADCVITVIGEDFNKMLENPQLGMQLFFEGKMSIEGDLALAIKLQQIIGLGNQQQPTSPPSQPLQ